jgi:hypothetical protein
VGVVREQHTAGFGQHRRRHDTDEPRREHARRIAEEVGKEIGMRWH